MSLLSNIRRLIFIDLLIQKKATGNPCQFAQKNRLSRSHMMNVLKDMKELGYPIKYSRDLNTYYYDNKEKTPVFSIRYATVLTSAESKMIQPHSQVDNICFSEVNIFEKC